MALKTNQPPRLKSVPSRNDTVAATKAYARAVAKERKPYLKFAFANPFNLSLLAGGVVAGIATLSGLGPVILAATAGLEAIWLLNAPGSELLRKTFWDPKLQQLELEESQKERFRRIAALPHYDQERIANLVTRQTEIHRLASENPSFTGDLLRQELDKTAKLVDSFIDMAVTCNRFDSYLNSIDIDQLERDKKRWETKVRTGKPGDPQTEIAKKNLDILIKRSEKIREIQKYLSVAHGQVDLIENSFQYIADQIVTMQSPSELSGQLDELLIGVDSIKETAADTERLLAG